MEHGLNHFAIIRYIISLLQFHITFLYYSNNTCYRFTAIESGLLQRWITRLRNGVVFSDQCMSCRQYGYNLNITLWAITPSLSSSANLRISSSSFSRCFLLAFVQLSYIIQSHSLTKSNGTNGQWISCFYNKVYGGTLVYIHELVVRARQLASVAQLVRALHRNRRAAGSIPARDLKLHFSLLFLVRSNKCIQYP